MIGTKTSVSWRGRCVVAPVVDGGEGRRGPGGRVCGPVSHEGSEGGRHPRWTVKERILMFRLVEVAWCGAAWSVRLIVSPEARGAES